MFYGLFIIIACQILGEAILYLTHLPLSAPVIGIALFVAWLALRARRGRSLEREEKAADGLLGWLGLFFVPAGVGLMQHFGAVRENAWPLIATLLLSTAITMGVTALVFAKLMQKKADQE